MISKIIATSEVENARKEINDAHNIVIVSHYGPDGDSLGSSLGMWHFLKKIGKNPKVIIPTPPPSFLMWMPGAKDALIYVFDKEKADKLIQNCDLVLALDFNTPSRLVMMEETVLKSKARKVLIDHHLDPDYSFVDVVMSYPKISSTSELVFRFIYQLGFISELDLNSAQTLYTGMMTDTGGFTFNSNQKEIYTIISELLDFGFDKDAVYRKVYNTFSENRMRLQGYCIYEKMKVYPEYQAALITLSKDEMKEFSYENGDAEGFVNIPLSIDNIVFSVFLREDWNKVKVSLRSQGTFPANKFAAEIFNGGGHLNASGGESYSTLEEAIQKFENGLPLFKEYLEKDSNADTV